MDRHDNEAGDPARGVQGAAADRARRDGRGQQRADGRPDRERGGGEGGWDHHGVVLEARCRAASALDSGQRRELHVERIWEEVGLWERWRLDAIWNGTGK